MGNRNRTGIEYTPLEKILTLVSDTISYHELILCKPK